jgi:ATP-binding cassette subfamily B protein
MIKRKDLRLSYAMVLQDTWLFEGTVYDNLIYGNDNVTFDDVKSAATAARIDTFIESLPNGYDTILSEGGTNISKGQKQLLTIARAMLLDAKMLILDEATSNVDTRTEIKIQEAMKNLMKDKTSFIIAHRLSTIKNADTILVIKDGEIVEQGNHEELLNKNGFYKELYISQFNN